MGEYTDAGWSSLVARRAHNPKVRGSNPLPATKAITGPGAIPALFAPPTYGGVSPPRKYD